VTARFLARERRVDPAKIRVIPNGVDLALFPARPQPDPGEEIRLLYFGTLTSWQGVELAVRATAQVCAHTPARLIILGGGHSRQKEQYAALAAKLGIGERLELPPPVDHAQVGAVLAQSFAVLAPLAINDRNTRQGCCPLKILEGMAAGVPVIASDLPVVRELGEHGQHLLTVKPGSVDQIAQAVLQLHQDRALWQRLSQDGRAHVAANYTWERAGAALAGVCTELGISLPSSV
jgi:glycosyltransferase involved in cell wall biosynthesis